MSKASETPNEGQLPTLRAVEDRIRAPGIEGYGEADKGHLSGDPAIAKQTALRWQPGESIQGEEQQSPRRKVAKCERCSEPGLRSQEQSGQGAGAAPGRTPGDAPEESLLAANLAREGSAQPPVG